MPIPYTPDAVKAIRFAFKNGNPRHEIQSHLGWDNTMFDRVCRTHGIEYGRASPKMAELIEQAEAVRLLSANSSRKIARHNHRNTIEQKPKDTTNFTICINAATRAELEQTARANDSSLSAVVRSIVIECLESGAAARAGAYRGATRGEYITIAIQRSIKAALAQASQERGHPNLSEFCAAIIQRHLIRVAAA